MSVLLIKNGLLCDSSGETKADLLIENGKITVVGTDIKADADIFDATGLVVMPSFTDLHCHLRTPGQIHKETIDSGTLAAVRGGYTTLNAMANTTPVCSSLDIAKQVTDEAARLGRCDVYQSLSLTKDFDGETLTHLSFLNNDTGQGNTLCASEDGYGVANGRVLLDALRICKEKNLRVLIHAEDKNFSAFDMAIAEDLETLRDLHIAEVSGLPVHFCHVSTEVSANTIIAAKQRGVPVTWEVTPHHIALNDSVSYGVNPPLRPESDRQAIIKAVKAGYVDAIATDHAPHTPDDKEKGAPGMVGLETAFAVCYTTLVRDEGLALSELVRLMSTSPAKLLGINKGVLRPCFDADITVADLNERFTVDSSSFASKGRNTPFDGRTVYGKIITTIKSGKIVFP